MAAVQPTRPSLTPSTTRLPRHYATVRSTTLRLCAPLATEDFIVQSMPDASPAKWHLAHTTWFFEEFILKAHVADYRAFHPRYAYLFNSYYQSVGAMHDRPRRGVLTRPTVDEIRDYRAHVDAHMHELLEQRGDDETIAALTTLGLNHEQQHQELLLTDVKHLFSCNPLQPAYRERSARESTSTAPLQFIAFEGGVREIGAHDGQGFVFDSETPRHRVFVQPYALADRLVTNGEYLEFMRDVGYGRPELWLSDGWTIVNTESWLRPMYWADSLDCEFTLAGPQPLDFSAPVSHLSYYEADAFARWAGARLPTEAEWELATASLAVAGNLLDSDELHPRAARAESGLQQMFGDVWEWTSSPYAAYPGYRPLAGALGEYNGKFMCNQIVLRGGSCVTPADHIRATYRNFFYAQARWQFTGVRLARNL